MMHTPFQNSLFLLPSKADKREMDECASGWHHQVRKQPVCHSKILQDVYFYIFSVFLNLLFIATCV